MCANVRSGNQQVMPIVRETAAQALAAAAQPLDVPSVQRLLALLLSLAGHKNWHVRHGALVSRAQQQRRQAAGRC